MSDISFEQVAIEHPALDRLLGEFRAIFVHGGALLGCFAALGPDVSDWFVSLYTIEAGKAIECFLSSSALAIAFPELEVEFGLRTTQWNEVGRLAFGGELGDALLLGGCHSAFSGTYQQARELASEASDAIFGDRWQDVVILGAHRGWSGWFNDIAWDRTWIIGDRANSRVWLICYTDLD